ncbi:MAG: MMPL family transporter [Desulfobacteraceae bacterium]|nr:MMPL family transporter [Desulfobacteraceae bacterium]
MFIRFLMFGANHRLITFLFLAIITFITGFGLYNLSMDTSFQSLIPESHPDKKAYDKIVREFGSDNRSIVYVKDKELWSKNKLAALGKLHFALKELESVKRVDDLFTMRSIRGDKGKIDSRIILEHIPKDLAAIERAKADALYNPLLVDNVISRDGTATAIIVTQYDTQDKDIFDANVNKALEDAIAPFKTVFQDIFQVGEPRVNAELTAILFSDLKLLAPLSALVLVSAILFFLRSGFAAFVPLVTSALSILWTFGIMGWINLPLNILTAMLPSLIVVIGSTEDTHMIASYFQGICQTKENHRTFATRYMMKHLGVPLILTVLTTALGFASNMFNTMEIIQEFALASTIAIFANGLITWLLVPLVLSCMGPLRTRIFKDNNSLVGLPAAFVKMFGYTKRRFPRFILLATALLCAFFIYQCSNLVVTNDPLSYFRKDQPIIADTQKIHKNLAGMKFFYITLTSDREKAFLEPEMIKQLAAIQDFMEKQ